MSSKERKTKHDRNRKRAPRPDAVETASPGWILYSGVAALLVAVAAALMLSIARFAGMWLPGCGPGGGCDKAAESVWGSVPGLGWPTSSVGLAYFLALLVGWIAARGAPPPAYRIVVRLGAAASVVFFVAMAIGGYLCVYCMVAHLANFAFLTVVELARRATPRRTAPVLTTASAAFVLATGVLGVIEAVQARAVEEHAESELAESTERVTSGSERQVFTGRYRHGPEEAPIRLVIFSDYQCTDCKKIETDVRQILAERDDVSLSVKQFPFCTDCNPYMTENRHPNACWAARAAEAAGILGGDEAFFRMHEWLFDRAGTFDRATLSDGLRELGFDEQEFLRIMQDDALTLTPIQADIEEGKALGLHYTPMIFVNGVELKGFTAPNAVRRTVEAVAATNPDPATAEADRPPTAAEKYVADWQAQPRRLMVPDARSWPLGPEDGTVHVVVWSDYQAEGTGEVDAAIRAIMEDRSDVRYEFRQFPADESCNPVMTRTIHPLGCLAAQASEAAARLGGRDARWRMHDWLLANLGGLGEAKLRAAAPDLGLDPDELLAEMQSPDVAAGIAADAQAGKRYGLRTLPLVVINGKRVPRWKLEGADVLGAITELAARQDATR